MSRRSKSTSQLGVASVAQLKSELAAARKTRKVAIADEKREILKAEAGDKRGALDRGWKLAAPTKGKERAALYAINPDCFLLPNHSDPGESKFPVCDKNGKFDPRGARAAYRRARQWGYEKVAEEADILKKEGSSALKSSKRSNSKEEPLIRHETSQKGSRRSSRLAKSNSKVRYDLYM